MAEGPDLGAVLKGDARADHHVGPDGHVGAHARVEAEPDGGGIDERGPSLHRGPAQPVLDNAFGGGELDAVVDAHDLFRRRFGDGTDAALRPDDGREVGQVVLAALVVVADRIQQREEPAPVDRHHAGVAERDRALLFAGLGVLDDAGEGPVRRQDEPAVLRWILRSKTQDRGGRTGALAPRLDEPLQGFAPDQRRVRIEHEHVAVEILQQRTRGRHRMGGAEGLVLHHAGERAVAAFQTGGCTLELRSDHQHRAHGRKRTGAGQDVLHHRPPGQRMEDLRQA